MSRFRLWLEENELTVPQRGPAIFLDLDNTLVHSMSQDDLPLGISPRLSRFYAGCPRAQDEVEEFIVCLRPGARRFVDSLSTLGDVFILSLGTQPYVDAVQKAVGFKVRRAFSARELPPGTLAKACQLFRDDSQVRPFILVDNLDAHHPYTRHKFGILGLSYFDSVETDRLFQLAPTWYCDSEASLNDRALSRILPAVRAKLSAQRQTATVEAR